MNARMGDGWTGHTEGENFHEMKVKFLKVNVFFEKKQEYLNLCEIFEK